MKINPSRSLAFAGLGLAAILFCAWQTTGSALPVKPYLIRNEQDTSMPVKSNRDKKELKNGDIDLAMKELDKAMIDLDKNMKIDFTKMDKELKQAMEEIKKIDFEKIGRDVAASLKEVKWDKIRSEVDQAMREAEVKIKEVDMIKIEKELQRVKEEMKQVKIHSDMDVKKIKKSVEEGLKNARTGIEKAKKELGQLKEFTDNLEKDGLIDKQKAYLIEIKGGELYINGKQQSKEVTDKYRKYLKDEDYTLRNDGKDQ